MVLRAGDLHEVRRPLAGWQGHPVTSDGESADAFGSEIFGEAPDRVVKMALKAANLIGDGFYGVDIKQVGKRLYVIEINDNPNVDAGNEDSVLKDALYREVMGVFLKRIEAHKRGAPK